MLLVRDALRLLALQHAPLVALIGSRMINPFLDQQGPFPAIAFRCVTRSVDPTMTSGDGGHEESTYRFFSTAKGTAAMAQALAVDAALKDAILGFQGTVSNSASPIQSGEIQGIFFENAREFYDDTTSTYQVATDYEVHYTI